MIELQLRLRPAASGKADAWLILGSDARRWVTGIQELGLAAAACRALIVPASSADPSPSGLLVLPGAEPAMVHMGTAIPYTVRAGRLAHPAQAAIWPPLADDEIAELFPQAFSMLHPGIGRIGYEAADFIDVADLFRAPPRRQVAWGHSPSAPTARLEGIDAIIEMDVGEFLDLARDGIGSEDPQKLRSDGRDVRPLERLGAEIRGGMARILLGIHGVLPGGAASPTWADRMGAWARQQLTRADATIDRARNREIARLLRLLQDDPDRALRYALPIGGGGAHRGLAAPGTRLGARSTLFDLGSIGRSGPADYWHLAGSVQMTLAERYRSAAKREEALGRHRRAAYIHAHLLHDFEAAAQVLDRGGHHREAALLWRDHLKRPQDAAECLERGGLWAEAAALWRQLGDREREAVCWERSGDLAAARAVWSEHLDALVASGDIVRAATIADQRLGDPARATDLLAAAWPSHHQAAAALRLQLQILGRTGRHAASQWTCDMVAASTPASARQAVAEALADTASSYPDHAVRAIAADAVRVIVGSHLTSRGAQAGAIVGSLPRSMPQDALLARDIARWNRKEAAARRPMRPAGWRLGDTVAWQQAASAGSVLVAVGFSKDDGVLCCARVDLRSGAVQRLTWSAVIPEGPLSFFLRERSDHLIAYVHSPDLEAAPRGTTPVIPIQRLPANDVFTLPLTAGTHGPLAPGMQLACGMPTGGWWLLCAQDGGVVLRTAPERGPAPPVRSIHLDADAASWTCLVPIGEEPALLAGDVLRVLYPYPMCRVQLPSAGTAAWPLPGPEQGVVVALEAGMAAAWWDDQQWRLVPFAEAWAKPLVTCTRDGLVIGTDGSEFRSWRCVDGHVRLEAEWQGQPGGSPMVALVPGPGVDDVVALHRDGTIDVIVVPPSAPM